MKKTWIAIAVIIALGAVWWFKQGGSDQYGWVTALPTPTSTPTMMVTKSTSTGGAKTKPVAATPTPMSIGLSYTQLVKQFGVNRISFDQNCQAEPEVFSVKNGTSILLDNRSNQARTINIDGKQYALVGYGYQVATVTSASLPKTVGLKCDSSINSGTIQIQANISGQ